MHPEQARIQSNTAWWREQVREDHRRESHKQWPRIVKLATLLGRKAAADKYRISIHRVAQIIREYRREVA